MAFGSAVNSGHIDANRIPSITGVQGTLGTADVTGSAMTLPFGVDPSTGAMYVNILAGAGAASNPTSGTLSTLGTVGTILGIGGTVQVSGASAGTNVNIVTGSQQTLGTVGTVTNLGQVYNAGTVQNILGGTIQNSVIPTLGVSTFGTHGTTGATVFGTLAGGTSSGAGTEIFVTSLSLSMPSTAGSQDVSIGWGTNGGTFHAGTGLIVRGNFPAGGGIQKNFATPINSGTNAQLTVFQAGAGTVDVSVTFFVTASTL